MTGLIMAGQLILGLAILVTLHELGHFIAARAFGIRVEKFYLFFDAWGFKFFSFTKGDTEYGMGWLPLGGYVKIAGMIDESLDTEQLSNEPQPWEFRSKPAWQRLIVMLGGVTMNVILGIFIFSSLLLFNKKEYLPNSEVKDGIYAYKMGEELGLQTGDKIIAINGHHLERFEDLLSTRIMFGATLTVERNGQTLEIVVPEDFYKTAGGNLRTNFVFLGLSPLQCKVERVLPGENAEKAGIMAGDKFLMIGGEKISNDDELKEKLVAMKGRKAMITIERNGRSMDFETDVTQKGTIGVELRVSPVDRKNYAMKPYTLTSAFVFGTADAIEALVSNAKGLKQVVTGKIKATESVQGPIGIAQIYGGSVDWGRFWTITGLLSMVLAFMNILPIPALDGGHVIFLIIESVTRHKFSDKFMERSQVVGMVIVLALMAFAIGNDIWKHILN
jgi:regulator of sigma E protease